MKKQPIIGYVRVSTLQQSEDTHALEQQTARVKAAGAKEIYQDIESGTKDDRPALAKVMNLVRHQKVGGVIVTRIDRLCRSLPKLCECVPIFLESGVNLIILDQQIDLSTPQGKLMLNILGSMAEWESDQLSDRVRHGKAHRRKQKKACESFPWGYEVKNEQYLLDHTPFLCLIADRPENYKELYQADIEELPYVTIQQLARECIETYLHEKSSRRVIKVIFAKYGIEKTKAKTSAHSKVFFFVPNGLRRWINNPVLCGHTVYNKQSTASNGKRKNNDPSEWQIIRDTHPQERLMSDEEAAEIREIMRLNARSKPFNEHQDASGSNIYKPYAYQGKLVFCDECGSRCMTKTTNDKRGAYPRRYSYFVCRHAGIGCKNVKSVRKEKVEAALVRKLVEASASPKQAGNQSDPTPVKSQRLKQLEAKLKALEQIPGYDPDVENSKAKTRQEIAEEINPFTSESLDSKTVSELIKAGNNLAVWYTLSNDEKFDLYPKLVQRITIRNGEVENIILNA